MRCTTAPSISSPNRSAHCLERARRLPPRFEVRGRRRPRRSCARSSAIRPSARPGYPSSARPRPRRPRRRTRTASTSGYRRCAAPDRSRPRRASRSPSPVEPAPDQHAARPGSTSSSSGTRADRAGPATPRARRPGRGPGRRLRERRTSGSCARDPPSARELVGDVDAAEEARHDGLSVVAGADRIGDRARRLPTRR